MTKNARKQRITTGFAFCNLILKESYLCSVCPVWGCWEVEISTENRVCDKAD